MLTIALSSMSCGVQKKAASETRTQSQSSTVLNSEDTLHIEELVSAAVSRIVEAQSLAFRETTSTTDESVERVIEIFDTSQTADSVTGTPPLLSRTREKRSVTNHKGTAERTESSVTASETEFVSDTTVTDYGHSEAASEEMHEKTDTKIREEKQEPGYLTALKLVCSLAVSIFLWWLSRKVIKRFSNKH